jgi:hypothetical protein
MDAILQVPVTLQVSSINFYIFLLKMHELELVMEITYSSLFVFCKQKYNML